MSKRATPLILNFVVISCRDVLVVNHYRRRAGPNKKAWSNSFSLSC